MAAYASAVMVRRVGEPGRHDDGVAVVGPGLRDRRRSAGRIVERHDVGPSPERAARRAAGHHLGKAGEVRPHPEGALGAAGAGAEAHHFVEDQHDAVLAGDAAQPLQEPGLRQRKAGRRGQRIDDHRGQPAGVLADELRARLGVVERQHQHLLRGPWGEPGGRGHGAWPGGRAEVRVQRRPGS